MIKLMRFALVMRLNLSKYIFLPIVVVALLFSISSISEAATFTWDGEGGDDNFSTGLNWVGDTAPTGVSGDDLVFTGTTRPTPNNDIVDGTFSSVSITATGFKLKGNDFTLDGGSTAISHTTGSSTIATNITFSTAAPTITVSGTSNLNITGTINNGGLAITVDVTGTFAVSGVISGTGAMIQINTGRLILSGANTFSGGLTVKQGTFVSSVSNSGTTSGAAGPSTSGVTLGASDGGGASIMATTSTGVTMSNPITLGTSAVGTLSIGRMSTAFSQTYSGALALGGNNVTLSTNGSTGGLTFSGGITGTGNVTLSNGGSSSTMTFSTNPINNVGTLTHTGSSSGTVTISGGIGANVTTITLNSTTSALTISTTAITVNSTATTLINSSGTKILTVSGGTTGTGNLIVQNNSNTTDGITISSTSINHTGTITNSGSGTSSGGAASVTISAVIGTNVTGVVQNSSTAPMKLTGANTFTGGLTVQSGSVIAGVSNSGSTSGAAGPSTSTITLGSSSGAAASMLASSAITVSNPITLGSGAVGTSTIGESAVTSSSVTFSGAIALNGNDVTIKRLGFSGTALVISGGITGTGNVYFDPTGSVTSANITVSTNPINNVGFIASVGSVVNTLTITGGIGSNVTGVLLKNDSATVLVNTTALTVNSGGTTLTNSATSGSRVLYVTGGINGTGNLIFNATKAGVFTIGAVDNVGTITNSGPGSGTVTITGAVGSNVTEIIENSAASAITIHTTGALTVNSGGTTLTNNNPSGTKVLTVSGGVTGTGNLILNNNSSINSGILVSTTAVNHTGTITNSGTGSGYSSVTAVISTNVTGLAQNSSTSELYLSGANTFTGGLTVQSGTVYIGVSNATTVSGAAGPSTSAITLGSSSGGATTISAITSGFTLSNPINIGSGAVGTTTITNGGTTMALTVSGAIDLNGNDLALGVTGTSGSLTVSGDITGTGDIIATNAGTSGSTLALSGSSINNVGTLSVDSSSTGTVTLGAAVGGNVTHFRYISSGGGKLTASNSNTFNAIRDNDGSSAHTISFGGGTTQTVGTWEVSGASGAAVTLSSTSGGSSWTVTSATAGNQVSDYLTLSDSIAAGTSEWFAGANSTDGGSNTGWSFTGIPTQLSFSTGPAYTNYGATIPSVIVHIQDAAGSLVNNASDSVSLSIANNPNGGTLSGTLSKAAVAGVATFNDLSIDKAGRPYTLSASASGLTGITSSSFDITSSGQGGGSSGGGGGGGGGGSPSYTAPAPTPAPAPASLPVTQATVDSLIKQLQELQQKISDSFSGIQVSPRPGAPGIVISHVAQSLTIGGRGDEVQSLQNFLISRSIGVASQQLKDVGATSYFGSLTQAALAEFQKSVGIYPAVGYFGPITKAYLKTIGY